jgi:hypothetical protein
MLSIYGRKCLSCKAVHKWVEKFSQGFSKVADDTRPGRPVEIATEATVMRVEGLIRADRRITIDSKATALGCSHGLAHSIMHDPFKFRKVCVWWLPRELKDRGKINRLGLSLQHLLRRYEYAEHDCYWGRIIGTSLPACIKACFNAMETSQFTVNQKARSLRLHHQLERLCLWCLEIPRKYC